MLSTLIAAATVATAPTLSEVTIYNGGFGLVKENRTLNLKQGVKPSPSRTSPR